MDLRALDLNLLLVFDALARAGTVTAAARAVGLSQPATSAALARLRAHLDDPLFVREGARMVPTPRARSLAPTVRRALDELGAAFSSARFDASVAERTFTVWCGDALAVEALPGIAACLVTEAPGITVRAVSGLRTAALDELARGEVDLVLDAFTDAAPPFRLRALASERFVTVVPRASPRLKPEERAAAAAGERVPLSLESFLAFPHVLHSVDRGGRGMVDDALTAEGLGRRVCAVVPYFLAIPAVVAAADACATVPERVARRIPAALALACFEPPVPMPTLTLSAVWHERTDNLPAHVWFRELVLRAGLGDGP